MLGSVLDLIVAANASGEVNFFGVSRCVDRKNSGSTRKGMTSKRSHTSVGIDSVQLTGSCLSECSLFNAFDHDYGLVALCIAAEQKVGSEKAVARMFSIEVCAKIEDFD